MFLMVGFVKDYLRDYNYIEDTAAKIFGGVMGVFFVVMFLWSAVLVLSYTTQFKIAIDISIK
jgi:hypothetical protein